MNNKIQQAHKFLLGFLIGGSLLIFPLAMQNQSPGQNVLISVVTGESDTDELMERMPTQNEVRQSRDARHDRFRGNRFDDTIDNMFDGRGPLLARVRD